MSEMSEDWVTTTTILDRLRDADDSGMWGRFQTRFQRPLSAFAQRMGLSQGEADDAVQECLLAFFTSYRDGKYVRGKGRLSSWLFAIAYNLFANARRRKYRELAHRAPQSDDSARLLDVPDENEATRTWEREWEEARLEAAIRQTRTEVSDSTFEVFDRVVRQGRSPDVVATELGMTRDAVYVAKHRALKRIRELACDFDDLPPAAA